MMMRNPRSRWYTVADGALTLTARPEGLSDFANPSFLARRQQHADATATTVVRFEPQHEGDRAGLVALQNDDFWISITVGKRWGKRAVLLEWGPTGKIRRSSIIHAAKSEGDEPSRSAIASAPLPGKPDAPVYLRIVATGKTYRFDYAVAPGAWKRLGTIDGTILSTKTAGGFIGAVFGVYAHSGT
jgi:alpha-N-arabinofuranosidase